MRQLLAKHKNKLIVLLKSAMPLRGINPRVFIHADVPYFCQWESRTLAKSILEHRIKAEEDPRWSDSGAISPQEYADWSWAGCGMACLKMILAHALHETIPLVTLGKRCQSYGGYKMPLHASEGLYYKPFTEFVAKEFGLVAKASSSLSLFDAIRALSTGGYVMASVTPEIRSPEQTPKSSGGHLLLIVGYDLDKRELYFHNPSGTNKANQEYVRLGFKEFRKFFSHRGILINK